MVVLTIFRLLESSYNLYRFRFRICVAAVHPVATAPGSVFVLVGEARTFSSWDDEYGTGSSSDRVIPNDIDYPASMREFPDEHSVAKRYRFCICVGNAHPVATAPGSDRSTQSL